MPSVRDRGGMPSAGEKAGEANSGALETLKETKQLSKKKASEHVDGRGETATEQVFPITVVNDVKEGAKRRCFATILSTDTWGVVKVRAVIGKLEGGVR